MDATPLYQRVRPGGSNGDGPGPLIKAVKAVDGNLFPWHNESLSEREPWVGWRTVYEELVKSASA